ncbi:14814_t:CDS:2, partial [Cetraspora pellucida]
IFKECVNLLETIERTNKTVDTYLNLIYEKVKSKKNKSDESDNNISTADDNEENLVNSNYNDDNEDFFYKLESNSIQVDVKDNDKVTYYVKLKKIKLIDDSLE